MNTEISELNTRKSFYRQPLLGGFSLIMIITCCLLIISSFSAEMFASWVSFLFMCCVPVQIVCSLVLEGKHPKRVASLSQPYRGLAYIAIAIIGGSILALLILFVVAQGAVPPGPQHNVFIILFIVVLFWLVVIFQCQPFKALFKRPSFLALLILASTFLIDYIFFFFVINFEFINSAPFYTAKLNGSGPVMAFDFLTSAITTVASIMALVVVDFKPIAKLPAANKNFIFIIWSAVIVLCLSFAIKAIFVNILGFDQIVYMVMVPISFIFGVFVLVNLFEKKLVANLSIIKQPYMAIFFCVTFASIIYQLFMLLGPIISGNMEDGAPSYELNFWAANAMLAISFPLIVAFSDFFQYWPFRLKSKNKN